MYALTESRKVLAISAKRVPLKKQQKKQLKKAVRARQFWTDKLIRNRIRSLFS